MFPKAEVAQILREGDQFLVAAHFGPDGDALGATAAVGYLLEELGKEYTLFNESPLPPAFDWMSLPRPLHQHLPDVVPSWVICLDCSEAHRLGKLLPAHLPKDRVVVIDHHLSDNGGFGSVNWIDTNAAATCELVADLADVLGIPLTGPLGEAIYLGLCTDTGNFRFDNVSPKIFELAARIVRLGLRPGVFTDKLEHVWDISRMKLWAACIAKLSVHHEGKTAVIPVTQAMIADCGASEDDVGGLVNFVQNLKGLKVSITLRETADNMVKFSLRSVGEINVREVAGQFGGGGHRNAAGGRMDGTLDEVAAALVAAVGKLFEDHEA